jgi:hypothetical protein
MFAKLNHYLFDQAPYLIVVKKTFDGRGGSLFNRQPSEQLDEI